MKMHTFIVGISLNVNMFRLTSLAGTLIDTLLSVKVINSKNEDTYFNQFSSSIQSDNILVAFLNEDKSLRLIIKPDQFVLRKTSYDDYSSIQTEKVLSDFELLWNKADVILKFPPIRRIGLVAEFRLKEKETDSAANDLIKSFLIINPPAYSGRFNLTYEDRELKENGSIANKDKDDYWNTIYTFYPSSNDENPEDGKINANIDVQKYYNPAKTSPIGELHKVKKRFIEKKSEFKQKLIELGLVGHDQ